MSDFNDLELSNMNQPVLKVKHASLNRCGESEFRSECPACKIGILPMHRDEDLKLLKEDRCLLCAQMIEYIDIT